MKTSPREPVKRFKRTVTILAKVGHSATLIGLSIDLRLQQANTLTKFFGVDNPYLEKQVSRHAVWNNFHAPAFVHFLMFSVIFS